MGPIWRGGTHGERELLRAAYQNSLALAEERGLRSVAFPSISTGAYRFPIQQAAPIAVQAVADFLRQRAEGGSLGLQLVRFVLFSPEDLRVYRQALLALPEP